MKSKEIRLFILCLGLFYYLAAPPISAGFETDTDRPGLDYRSFDMPWNDVDICQEACDRDSNCRAWTYVKPDIQGPYSRCWLKYAIPDPRPNSCCISGIKGGQEAFDTTSPANAPRDCSGLRSAYFKQCDEIKGFYADLNCKKHGYSGCALDVVSCFTPFLPSHVFTDEACGRPGFIGCATDVYDRHLVCLRNCNEKSIGGRLPEGLRKCTDGCRLQIESELKTCQ